MQTVGNGLLGDDPESLIEASNSRVEDAGVPPGNSDIPTR